MSLHTFVILAYGESDDLEECIKSVLKQSSKSQVIVATSTPSDYILDLASKYGLGVIVNKEKSNKGRDYNFAINYANTKLVTIAHQDDLYNRNYTKEIVRCYKENKDATIIFTDNYEIKKDAIVKKSHELNKKRYFLLPLSISFLQNKKFFKMRALRRQKYICTSSITFVKKNLPENIFPIDLKYHNDWQGLINLAKDKTRFVYLRKRLVGYRMDNINVNSEKEEETLQILEKNYPSWYFKTFIKKKDKKNGC